MLFFKKKKCLLYILSFIALLKNMFWTFVHVIEHPASTSFVSAAEEIANLDYIFSLCILVGENCSLIAISSALMSLGRYP